MILNKNCPIRFHSFPSHPQELTLGESYPPTLNSSGFPALTSAPASAGSECTGRGSPDGFVAVGQEVVIAELRHMPGSLSKEGQQDAL